MEPNLYINGIQLDTYLDSYNISTGLDVYNYKQEYSMSKYVNRTKY